jgi:hypothetical protein
MPDPRSRAGMPDLYAYAHLLAEEKRRSPGSDVMSILLAEVDADGGRVSVEEFENLFWLFAIAGNETLRNGLPGGMIALLVEHPWAQQALRDRPALLPSAVEEMLRWWTPVMTFRRTATRACALAGVPIPAGDKVVVSFIAANRDEAVFPRPDVFDIARAPNPHLAFGLRPALLPRRAPGPAADASPVCRGARAYGRDQLRRRAGVPALQLPAGHQATARALAPAASCLTRRYQRRPCWVGASTSAALGPVRHPGELQYRDSYPGEVTILRHSPTPTRNRVRPRTPGARRGCAGCRCPVPPRTG